MDRRRIFFGIAFVTLAVLMLELALTRLFSATMYYHFAFMAISLALFGSGASGVFIYIIQRRLDETRTGQMARHRRAAFCGDHGLFALRHTLKPAPTGAGRGELLQPRKGLCRDLAAVLLRGLRGDACDHEAGERDQPVVPVRPGGRGARVPADDPRDERDRGDQHDLAGFGDRRRGRNPVQHVFGRGPRLPRRLSRADGGACDLCRLQQRHESDRHTQVEGIGRDESLVL